MSNPALGINSIIQGDVSDTTQPDSHTSSAESIWKKETWGDEKLTSYFLQSVEYGRTYSKDFPEFIEGNNFLAIQAGTCALRSLLNSIDNSTPQTEEGVAITINSSVTSSDNYAPFNFHQISGDENSIYFPHKVGNEPVVATVHTHPTGVPGYRGVSPSPIDLYALTNLYNIGEIAEVITDGEETIIFMPTLETPIYSETERMDLVELARNQIERRFKSEIESDRPNLELMDSLTKRYFRIISIRDRIVRECSIRLAEQLRIKMYHKSLESESKDTRFKRLV